MKNLSFRVGDEQAELLELVARVEGRSVVSVVRQAVDEWVAGRFGDPVFRGLVEERQRRDKKLMSGLSR